MSSITIKDIPQDLLERVRNRAAAERRSINKEFIQLVETALRGEQANAVANHQVAQQTAAWSQMAGSWVSDGDPAEEINAVYRARTAGRAVDL